MSSSEEEMQPVPARHGTATFVPKGSTIKIVNTAGTQVIDTWAFALPDPPKSLKEGKQAGEVDEKEEKEGNGVQQQQQQQQQTPTKQEKKKKPVPESPNVKKGRKSKDMGLPSQEEAEAAVAKGVSDAEQQTQQLQQQGAQQKAGWSSYLPSLRGKKQEATDKPSAEESEAADKAQQKENSRTWGSYLSTGQGFTSYLPSKGAISAFASSHQRDTSKSYAEQLADFSKTPVGAASLSALTGSGTASSLYAGYSAWNTTRGGNPAMEYLSLAHTRASTCHLVPRVDDVLVSNLREPMLTLVEDTTGGKHDTLMAACDPQRYHQLGVEDWEEHGSCAENLVLALKELNERAGLKGDKGIGADVTINSVPAPLNLFMNVPWSGHKGDLVFAAPECKAGDFVRLRAERDVVVVMSACPQDVTAINGKDKEIKDGHFCVMTPDDEDEKKAETKKATDQTEKKPKRPNPRKLGSGGGVSFKRASVQPESIPLPNDSASETKSEAKAESTAEGKGDNNNKKPPETPSKKPNGVISKSAPPASPAPTPRPKGKPKKLIDPNTGEKKRPRKLEKRSSEARSSTTLLGGVNGSSGSNAGS